MTVQQRLEQPRVAEPVDERHGRQQRRREQRQQRDRARGILERHARTRERIGERERHRHDDRGDERADRQRMQHRAQHGAVLEIRDEVVQADEMAVRVDEAFVHDERERQQQEQ